MHEYRTPATYRLPEDRNCTDLLFDVADARPDQTVFRRQEGERWHPVSAGEAAASVVALAKGLIAKGIKPGDRVGLLSATRLEWTLLDFAIWSAGAIPVPIYDSSSTSQVDWIMRDSEAVAIIVETDDHRASVTAADAVTDAVQILQIDGTPGAVAELTEAGRGIADDEVAARRAGVALDSPATLIYTSGTTGRPKGCMLTHRNMVAEVYGIRESELKTTLAEQQRFLLFLPMAHVLARAINLLAIDVGIEIGYTSDIPSLLPTFAVFKPTVILSVPRVFEKVFNSAQQKAHDEGKGRIFDLAAETAIDYSIGLEQGSVGMFTKVKHAVFDKLVYGKLRAALGNECTLAVSGGAPLGARLGHFFRGIGIPVYEGYGLTETTAAICVNRPDAVKMGTVGRPLPGNAVRIGEDGEVLLQGDVVFTGYWNNPEATADTIVDGWFHTGDLGSLDDDGFLSITGRKKELIVTAGGKNVSPSMLEDVLRASPLISQAVVVGDQRPFIGALITIDEEAFVGWKERNGKQPDAAVTDLIADADLVAEVQQAIDAANDTVSHAEAIKKFQILPNDFSEDSGEMTPTLKVKRNVVVEKFSDDIDRIYQR